MSLRKRIESLRDEVRDLAGDQTARIDPLRLSAELDHLLTQTDQQNEYIWKKYQWRIELWKETKLELAKAVISFAQAAIRSLILVNGGAAIAVMTFIGNSQLVDKQLATKLSLSLLLCSIGVAAAALVAGCAYITQFLYERSTGKVSKLGIVLHWVAVAAALVSLCLFVGGLYAAYSGFALSVENM